MLADHRFGANRISSPATLGKEVMAGTRTRMGRVTGSMCGIQTADVFGRNPTSADKLIQGLQASRVESCVRNVSSFRTMKVGSPLGPSQNIERHIALLMEQV